MKAIEIEYNRALKPLEAVMSSVSRPSDFFVSGVMELPMPKVEVEGAGILSFPVPDEQIAAIVRRAERAPYGRGSETIVDTSVRNVWQIAPDDVHIGGKSWAANFGTILAKVTAGLGCGEASVSAELYKLLVYERCGFFLPHRDTEKTAGMFGTLVVTLPSAHLGGGLRIRHAGREVTVDTSAAEFSELSYVAFYADCEHEVLPLRHGNRVCLVYNLIQKRPRGKGGILKAPEYDSQIAEAATILDQFLSAPDAPAKIAWLLEHQYSPAGLSFSALKSADAARARVLVQAAEQAQCAVHLGIVHIGDSGAAEPEYDLYDSSWDRYGYDEDEAEEQEEDDPSFTVIEVDDDWKYVDEWRGAGDIDPKFGPIPLADGELLPSGALDGEPPDEKRLMEASGNEGASYERSWHRAALVLWRQDRSADVLLQAGVVAALPYLKQLAAGGSRARPEAVAVAERIVDAWVDDSQPWYSYALGGGRPGPTHRTEMIATLRKLRASALLERFIRDTITSSYDGSENAALLASLTLLGDAKAAALLSTLLSARMPDRPNECAELLLTLTEKPSHCFPEVAEAAVAGLDRIGTRDAGREASDWKPEQPIQLSPQFVVHLFQGLHRFQSGILCGAAAEKITSRLDTFSLVTVLVPGIEQLCSGAQKKNAVVDSSVAHLWRGAAEFLLGRSEVPPEPPTDWRLNVKLSCSCPDCQELQCFALDPRERVHRFRIKKERRRHLHRVIDTYPLDMTHVTDRVGSPQTLVCTKDRRSFDRRMKQYQDEIAAMRTLVGLAPASGKATALSKRMQIAVKLAPRVSQ